MIVLYDNQTYEFNMPFRLFESYKERKPTFIVELVEITCSSYKKILHIEIQYVEDYSVARNLQALQN